MRGVGDVQDGIDRAACVTGLRLPDHEDVGGEEGVIRGVGVVVDVRPDADEVVVVSELGIVVEQVAPAGTEPTPAVGQIARVGGLGPAEDEQVGTLRDPECHVQPVAALRVVLDLRIGDRQAGTGTREGAVVRAADEIEVAIVDADLLVDHLDVVVRTDRTRAVGRRRRQLVEARAVEVVEQSGEWGVRGDGWTAGAAGSDRRSMELGRPKGVRVQRVKRLREGRVLGFGNAGTERRRCETPDRCQDRSRSPGACTRGRDRSPERARQEDRG